MTVPSNKGMIVQLVVDRLQALLDSGRLSRDELEARLASEDIAFFEGEKRLPTLWYPVRQTHRLLDLYYKLEGSRPEVIVDLGREMASPILGSPAFAQLFEAAGHREEASAGALLVKLSQLMLNFTKWSFHGASMSDFTIDVTEATEFADYNCLLTVGFLEALVRDLFHKRIRVVFERPTPDHIVFHPLSS